MTTELMIALLRSRHETNHALGDNMPHIPVGYRVHAM